MVFWPLSGSFKAVRTGLSTLGFWVFCTLLFGLTLGCADGAKDLDSLTSAFSPLTGEMP